ncbi:4'-phosphopantetheinyl transferase superfamily protein [Rhodanobacter sp. 7MK24]|uniref:4'-phosphopantetheinyl transferase family protein n=1 Tax=Rhodanobacter sp. 7MK24 TaxID=2775922 RepID=UPI00177BFD22|nr:4'-phosphopantetheinyl transferase superfamily protein [Rhodanobacter sp. 7MK24]MBD8881679.1 4'-phosphopantetheinyl transferase superfamily protein [Rhodanobacter sp. 7MK24]
MHAIHGFPPAKVAEPLRADEIHVWRLHRPKGTGRDPLLSLLARYLGIEAANVRLAENEHGRPRLDARHGDALDFNWSHSGEQALVALARGVAVGIDLEQRRKRANALAIARRFFTAEEADWLDTLDEEAQRTAFLELWTAREAVLKALGRGIAFGLDRLSFRHEANGLVLQQLDGDDPAAWHLSSLDIGTDALAALAWRGAPRRIRTFALADDE